MDLRTIAAPVEGAPLPWQRAWEAAYPCESGLSLPYPRVSVATLLGGSVTLLRRLGGPPLYGGAGCGGRGEEGRPQRALCAEFPMALSAAAYVPPKAPWIPNGPT